MARGPSTEEAVQRAQRAQEARIDAVRVLAEARQSTFDANEQAARKLAEVKRETDAQIADAERADVRAYNAAVASGWSVDELRKIGFDEPEKKKRVARRSRAAENIEHVEEATAAAVA
jgi:hypothetical protein